MSTEQPKISVIVPVYNVAQYLSRSLDSIVNQTYSNLEIILVNDGSSDNSGQICDDYAAKDSRIKVIHQPNQGPGAARNIGFETATAEWITCIDSDDFISPDCIERVVDAQINNPQADMIIWGIKGFTEENGVLNMFSLPYFDKNISPGNNIITNRLKTKIPVGPCDKLYRASIIKEHNLRFPVGIVHEDNVFCWHYFSYCKTLYYIPDKMYFYRQERYGSITHNTFDGHEKHTRDSLLGSKLIYDFWEKNGMLEDNIKLFPKIFSGMLKKSARKTPKENLPALASEAKAIANSIKISFFGRLRMLYAIRRYCK